MANINFQGDRLVELAMALDHTPWPRIEERYGEEIELLRSIGSVAGLLAEAEEAHHRFVALAYKMEKLAYPLPPEVTSWLGQGEVSPADLPPAVQAFFAKQKISPLADAARYHEATQAIARAALILRDRMLETESALATEIFKSPHPKLGLQTAKFFGGDKGSKPSSEPDPWELLGRALTSSDVEGTLYLGGDVADADIQRIERLIGDVVETSGRSLEWDKPRRGSWWRRFKTATAKRFSEADLDTLKRAAEVQILDRHESESAKNYAEAIAVLAEAVADVDHAYLAAKNVILLKTMDANGQSVTVSRVLTPREVSLYQAGALDIVLSESETALRFLRSGVLPVGELPSAEGDSGD